MQLIILFAIFVLLLLYSGILLYYRRSWLNIPVYIPKVTAPPTIPVTIIIPARNEAKNIEDCLNSITAQDYPSELLQILVVDDHSTDNTAALVTQFPNVRLVTLSDHVTGSINSYKKKAIETAMLYCTGEIIVSTDADCSVAPLWIRTIVSFYKERNAMFVVMPVVFSSNGSFLQIFQQLDFMSLQGVTGAAVSGKALNMCNGANMAYSRAAFTKLDGFKNIDYIASGDDMLLMQKIATEYPGNVFFLKSRDVIVSTNPMYNIRDFFNQRIRWASKAGHYTDWRITVVLLIVYLLNLFLLAIPCSAVFLNPVYHLGEYQVNLVFCWALLFGWKTVAELIFLFPVSEFFGEKKLLVWFPLAQPFHILYTVIAGWLGKFGKYQWKGREVK